MPFDRKVARNRAHRAGELVAIGLIFIAAPLWAQSGPSVQILVGSRVVYPIDMISFPDTISGTSSQALEFTLFNRGQAPIDLPQKNAVVISGGDAAAFSVSRVPDSIVQRQSSTNFDLVFTPPGVGAYSATVTVTTSDSVNPKISFEIFGYGSPNGPSGS